MIVKVCGITEEQDARAAIEAGANALGFNFWTGSPRYLAPDSATAFVPLLEGALKVGVFVDCPAPEIARIAHSLQLDVVQLHGSSSAPGGIRYWRAGGFDRVNLSEEGVEAFLLDAPAGALHGGTGKTFVWSLVPPATARIIVAGGLDASNVAEAISTLHPWGVDACSRLESSPGRKDHAKVAAFVAAALAAWQPTRTS
jgi:phosphoribosylanthranilate isomerase